MACGAPARSDAEWCWRCYSPLDAPAPTAAALSSEPAPAEEAVAPAEPEPRPREPGPRGLPGWPCPVCGERNALDLDTCAVCGASFARLFDEPQTAEPGPPPATAAAWSLALPGLGHIRVGRTMDGVARLVLFAWTVGTAILLLLSRASSGLGPMGPVAAAFLVGAVLIYGLSAIDAYRAASGEPPVLSSRTLLYGTTGLVMLSLVSIVLVIGRSVHG